MLLSAPLFPRYVLAVALALLVPVSSCTESPTTIVPEAEVAAPDSGTDGVDVPDTSEADTLPVPDTGPDVATDPCADVNCGDSQVCVDGECIDAPACAAKSELSGSEATEGDTTQGLASLKGYTCPAVGGTDHSASERIYTFVPDCDGEVTFSVTPNVGAGAFELDVMVLGACSAKACLVTARSAGNAATVTLPMTAAETLWIAVEGVDGPGGAFSVATAAECCVPACDDKTCGPDGCGGACGECPGSQDCGDDGQCICTPDCEGMQCGDDGCGGFCGQCAPEQLCDDAGTCVCDPQCGDKVCGPDACGGSCGVCDDGLECTDDWCKNVDSGECAAAPSDGWCVIDNACVAAGTSHPDNVCLTCDPDQASDAWSAAPSDTACGDDGAGLNCFDGSCCNPVPACDGVVCGDNGCGGSCGDCEPGWGCNLGTCLCLPECGDVECGTDGCDGSCGDCNTDQLCTLEGQCACVPVCEGTTCGSDGCGGSCGSCNDALPCTADSCGLDGQCVNALDPLACAIDGACQASGALNPANPCERCQPAANGTAWTPLSDGDGCGPGQVCFGGGCCDALTACLGKVCGDDGCGGSCGDCAAGNSCSTDGQCACVASCDLKVCGDDGCDGSCGDCAAEQECDGQGQCSCVPQCQGQGQAKSCGEDGCGGACGSCDDSLLCTADSCDAGVCLNTLEPFFCVIDSICVPANALDPANACQTCLPAQSASAWSTSATGTACEIGGVCFDGTCCDPGVNCQGKGCGDDGCGGSCGDCAVNQGCDDQGQCLCIPQCNNKTCGPDGCGGSCGDCGASSICDISGLCQCVPSCSGKQCGDDGCGGQCGGCASDDVCQDNQCVCDLQCAGRQCGDDSCGGSCGDCATQETCDAEGQCQCAPDCSGKTCGDDGCGGTCGACGAGDACDAAGLCQCAPACDGKQCGDDLCAGSCGDCAVDEEACDAQGQCQCVADCSGKVCGDDGCGGPCGDCAFGQACDVGGQCQCVPQCAGNVCGSDTCGGSCGDCPASDGCDSGSCVVQGDTCGAPHVITGIPFEGTGDTTGKQDDYSYMAGACPGETGGWGVGAVDEVWTFVAPTDARYVVRLEADFDSNLFVVTDCSAPSDSCLGAAEEPGVGTVETVEVDLTAGQSVQVVVDSWTPSGAGTYSLSIHKVGDRCVAPHVVDTLPFSFNGDSSLGSGDDYGYEAGQCPPETGGWGSGASDEAFAFVAPAQGDYTITLTPGDTLDSNLYVVSDCADIGGTCLAGMENAGNGTVETLTVTLQLDDAVFVVVDGWGGTEAGDYNLTIVATGGCTPQCAGKGCGDDGCGGSCGDCGPGTACDVDGLCQCSPQCDGKACGDDSCGGSCGDCGLNQACDLDGQCACLAQCDGKQCGDDGCGGLCGDCAANEICDGGGQCECVPQCTGSVCGDDGCGGSCGACLGASACDLGACIPQGDRCFNPYVIGALPYANEADTSLATPDYSYATGACPGETGGWGQGSSDHVYLFTPEADGTYVIAIDSAFDSTLYVATNCAAIDASCLAAQDLLFDAGNESLTLDLLAGTNYFIYVDGYSNNSDVNGVYTLTVQQPGDTCALAHDVGALPWTFDGGTVGLADDYSFFAGQCPGELAGWGGGSSDRTFSFTAPATSDYSFTLSPTDFDATLYVVADCADVGGSCLGGAQAPGFAVEQVTLSLAAGQTVFAVVDGYTNLSNQAGSFQLVVDATCTPDCSGKNCGADGCGGSCGTCTGGDACGDTGTCVPPGDQCAAGFSIAGLPFIANGDTSDAGDDYSYTAGACLPETDGRGLGAPDEAWTFVAPSDGSYVVRLSDAAFGGTVYVVSDCADIDNTCVGGDEKLNADEELVVALLGGQSYRIIVDGWSGGAAAGSYTLEVFALGDRCEQPFAVTALPFSFEGATVGAGADYAYSSGQCPGEATGWGAASADQVFAFVAPETRQYTVTLVADFDSTLFVTTDCADPGGSCLAANDEDGNDQTEQVTIDLHEGDPVFIVVDGYSNFTNIAGTYVLTVEGACTPACGGKACGDDGCGGTCGACGPTEACDGSGQCQNSGETCDTAIAVGSVPFSTSGDTSTANDDTAYSVGDCLPETGGWGDGANDLVWAFTAPTDGNYSMLLDAAYDSTIYVLTDCDAIGPATCLAGDDQIGDMAERADVTLVAGQTVFVVVDGFGFGAGGTFDLDIVRTGDTCPAALEIGALPFTAQADTGNAASDYGYLAGSCAPETGGWGAAANDQAWAFVAPANGSYRVTLDATYDSNLYVVSDCAAVDATCLAGDETLGVEEVVVTLTSGQAVFIIVDGWGNSSSQSGAYSLTVESACTATCDGKACGDDGCGGTCGDCLGDETCTTEGQCILEGDQCAVAFAVDSVPYIATGDTTTAAGDYGYADNQCPGESMGWGAGAPDEVYRFVPGVTGAFVIALDSAIDSNLYVVTDCQDIGGSCVAANENIGVGVAERLDLTLLAGQQYFVVVDGFANTPQVGGTYTLELFQKGDRCTGAFDVAALPFTTAGSTTDASNDYGFGDGECPGSDSGWGAGSRDEAYRFEAPADGEYEVTLDAQFDSALYAVTDCDAVGTSCLAADEIAGNPSLETLTLTLTAGQVVFVVVDGFGNTGDNHGAYSLTIEASAPLDALKINEVDYDNPSTDDLEFIELLNTSSGTLALAPYRLELVNGNGGAVYASYDLGEAGTGSLAAGQRLVLGDPGVLAVLPAGAVPMAMPSGPQNGAPDGMRIVRIEDGALVDGLAYEGVMVGVGEGGTAPSDNGSVNGLSRCVDGGDTGDNSVDFVLVVTSPGLGNVCP